MSFFVCSMNPPQSATLSPSYPVSGNIPCSGDGAAARAERRLRMLAELGDIGMELARHVRLQVLGEAGPDTAEAHAARPEVAGGRIGGADLGLVFSRIARAVRQTLALEARLDAEGQAGAVSAVQAGRAAAERKRVKQVKERIRRCVEDAIRAETDGSDTESLLLDLEERLEDPDIEDELGNRPIGVVVAGICADLRIEVDLSHFTDAELGVDTASMGPKEGPNGGSGGGQSGNEGGDAGLVPADTGPGLERSADRTGVGDGGGLPFARFSPLRLGSGHDPP